MNPKTTSELEKELASPTGKVIGFIDSTNDFEQFTEAVRKAGFPESSITSLYGEEGIHLLERLQDHSFFFGDSEDNIIQLGIRELAEGHFATAVEVANHSQAAQVASLAKRFGGHGFSYFGVWVNEQLTG